MEAPWVVVATNAYTGPGAVWPGIDEEIVGLPYFNLATAPLPPALAATILPGRQGAWDTRSILTSFRLDQSGRMVFGSVGALRLQPVRRAVHQVAEEDDLAVLHARAAAERALHVLGPALELGRRQTTHARHRLAAAPLLLALQHQLAEAGQRTAGGGRSGRRLFRLGCVGQRLAKRAETGERAVEGRLGGVKALGEPVLFVVLRGALGVLTGAAAPVTRKVGDEVPAGWAGKLGELPYPAYDTILTMKGPQAFPEKGDLTKPFTFNGQTVTPA